MGRDSTAGFRAMDLVCIDGHRWNVFVEWPDPPDNNARDEVEVN